MRADPMIGRKIKGYQILEVLGRGGMGAVYKAEHQLIGKQVAIKILQKAATQNPTVVSRFILEAKAVNDIRHENLIDILDFDQLEEGNPYIVMEYLEGQSLDDAVSQEAPFQISRVGHIGLQLCSALYAAHQKNVVHRDLKGDNVFLITHASQRNFVKVLDFGIAKLLDDRHHRTEVNALLGTPVCMSPEQIMGDTIDARTDIYALGVLLYQMTVGRPPFDDESPLALLAMHVKAPVPPPSQYVPQIPPALEQVILRCLEKDKTARYESMSQLGLALGEACEVESALYFGMKFMSQRLFSVPSIKIDKILEDNPTEALAPLPEEKTNVSPMSVANKATLILPQRDEIVDNSATVPMMQQVDVEQLTRLSDTLPGYVPNPALASAAPIIAPLEERPPEPAGLGRDVIPTKEMTQEEILSLTSASIAISPNKKKVPTRSSFWWLWLLLLLGVGFIAGWFVVSSLPDQGTSQSPALLSP